MAIRRKDIGTLDIEIVIQRIAQQARYLSMEDDARIDHAAALEELRHYVGSMPPPTSSEMSIVTTIFWHRVAVTKLRSLLAQVCIELDPEWCLRRMESTLELISHWPALYSLISANGIRRAEFAPGCMLAYRAHDDYVEILDFMVQK
ncbi:hypothetical protein [Burkholderia ubonensis]|uniref:hypothetical protein n=1 Tax=Burkholderia ubonensis TaxID=101571 RepID=UPI00075B63D3|nr:hypothetical protein [Burkholderia ubonensis]KVK96209.1 hypothetical protein WJ45_20025 [Burkholderia ubonensis]KVQ44340.1 hypothetical protein WK04_15530 [Burkholderia ubonensis]